MKSTAQMIEELRTNGFVVIQSSPADKATLKAIRRAFVVTYLGDIPEKKAPTIINKDVGLGKFGALNWASSYHCQAAIRADHYTTSKVEGILDGIATPNHTTKQAVPDRLMYRNEAQPLESVHRDQSMGLAPVDYMFGSMLNLNKSVNQTFTCVPGSHYLGSNPNGKAFTSASKEEKAALTKKLVKVVFEPGSILIFFENIWHTAGSKKPTTAIIRKFLGFLLSASDKPCYPENVELMKTQGALVHKGGKLAPLYAKLHWVNNRWLDGTDNPSTLETRSAALHLIPEMYTTRTYKSGKNKGQKVILPHEFPPSLDTLKRKYGRPDGEDDRFIPRKLPKMAK
jgi:hypothetical protein